MKDRRLSPSQPSTAKYNRRVQVRRHPLISWIAIVALLWSAVWQGEAFAESVAIPFGSDICSAASHSRGDPAAPLPLHAHKHCAACCIGGASHAITAPVIQACLAPPLEQARANVTEAADAPQPRVTASPPRGPPLTA
jgi:hypothetical protein